MNIPNPKPTISSSWGTSPKRLQALKDALSQQCALLDSSNTGDAWPYPKRGFELLKEAESASDSSAQDRLIQSAYHEVLKPYQSGNEACYSAHLKNRRQCTQFAELEAELQRLFELPAATLVGIHPFGSFRYSLMDTVLRIERWGFPHYRLFKLHRWLTKKHSPWRLGLGKCIEKHIPPNNVQEIKYVNITQILERPRKRSWHIQACGGLIQFSLHKPRRNARTFQNFLERLLSKVSSHRAQKYLDS